MTSTVNFQNGSTTKQVAGIFRRYVTTSDDNTANQAAITVSELASITEVFGVQIKNSSNVRRSPQGAVTISGNVVTIADSGLAADEVITFFAAM